MVRDQRLLKQIRRLQSDLDGWRREIHRLLAGEELCPACRQVLCDYVTRMPTASTDTDSDETEESAESVETDLPSAEVSQEAESSEPGRKRRRVSPAAESNPSAAGDEQATG